MPKLLTCLKLVTLLALVTTGHADETDRRPLTNADLKELSENLEVLSLRGRLAYGIDFVTDEGIEHLVRLTKLRVLRASGLSLTDAALATIGKLSSLEELELDSNRIDGSGLHHLGELSKLRRLSLNFNRLDASDFETLATLSGLKNLSVVGSYAVDDGVLQQCGRLSEMETLHLSENTSAVSDRGLVHLASLKRLSNFALRNASQVSDAGMSHLARLSQLNELTLSDLRSVTPAGLTVLQSLPELRRLHLAGVRVDDQALGAIAGLKKLERLLLWNVASKPLRLERLGELQNLRELRTNQPLSSTAVRALARLENLESILDELKEINDDDLKHLARLPKLHMLVLDSENITAASLPTLARMQSLRWLNVTDRVQITPAQWLSLGETSLPRCHIQRWFGPYTVYHTPR